MSGENCQGAPRSPPAQDEARGDDEALTPSAQIREIDDELVELRRERKKVVAARRRYRSEKQVAARRAARVRHLGAAVLAAPLAAVLVERAREIAGDDGWLFEAPVLADDGVDVECVPEEGG